MMHPSSSNSHVLPEEIDKASKETGISKEFFQGIFMIDIGIDEAEWEKFFKDRENKGLTDGKDEIIKLSDGVSNFKKRLREICRGLLEKDVESIANYEMKCILFYVKYKKAYDDLTKYQEAIKVIETIGTRELNHFDDKLLEKYELILGIKSDLVKAFNIVKKN